MEHQSAVYLLHGLMETAYGHFRPQIKAWRGRFRVLPVDLPGHGTCPLDAAPRYYAGALDYTVAVLEKYGPGRVVAASFLGGPVAVRCAIARPDLVSSLVLTGFVPDVPHEVFRLWIQSFDTASKQSPELAEAYRRAHGPRWPDTMAAVVREVEEGYHERLLVTTAMLASVPVPALLVNGANKSNERAAALELPARCPNLSGAVVDGAGHIPGRDRPAEFNRIVEDFWKQVSAIAPV